MKYLKFILFIILFGGSFFLRAQLELDEYIQSFDYESRKEMKISSEKIVALLEEDEAVLLDIRFVEEQAAWGMDYTIKMPLSELPNRFSELPKDKLIVTACPHKDRAIIAMVYLKSKGYNVAYLEDGLIELAEYLRGDNAKDFIKKLKD